MKTSHFEGSIAHRAAWSASGRDERTQHELVAFDFDFGKHGWSHRRIARELDINREIVGKYLRLARSKPAISTPPRSLIPIQNQPF